MLALAIDTSENIGGIALATEERLVAEYNFYHKMDLLRRLMPNIDRIISDAGKSRTDIDGIVIALGPGSFTGLRIGMTAAKSIAHVLDRPIVGIPTLDVLAHGTSAACPKSIAALIHAKPGEVFWAIYQCRDNKLEKISEDHAGTIREAIDAAKQEKDIVFCGDGAEKNREAIEASFGPSSVLPQWFNHPRAAVLAKLGLEKLAAGESDDLMSLVPTYVRKPTPVVRIEARKEWK
jgi:tRNA threonylcarbamoyladenosine biosynthesis protein TsaB